MKWDELIKKRIISFLVTWIIVILFVVMEEWISAAIMMLVAEIHVLGDNFEKNN